MAYRAEAHQGFNYWLMGFVVFIAVTLGHLAAVWIEGQVALMQMQKMTAKLSRETSDMLAQQKATLDAQLAADQNAAEQRRAQDSYGRKLRQECQEWTRAYAQTPGYTTSKNRDARCKAYREYVKSGKRSAL